MDVGFANKIIIMKTYLISDNIDTLTGMRLAGVEGEVVHTADEATEVFERVLKNKDIGIIMVTEEITRVVPDLVTDIAINQSIPLLVEIPDRHGTKRSPTYLTDWINESIGIKI